MPLSDEEINEFLEKYGQSPGHTPLIPQVDTDSEQLDVLLETPRFRYRARTSKVDPGWTRPCNHCYVVQYPFDGAFATFYHKCEGLGSYVEWPPSIGRNYA